MYDTKKFDRGWFFFLLYIIVGPIAITMLFIEIANNKPLDLSIIYSSSVKVVSEQNDTLFDLIEENCKCSDMEKAVYYTKIINKIENNEELIIQSGQILYIPKFIKRKDLK